MSYAALNSLDMASHKVWNALTLLEDQSWIIDLPEAVLAEFESLKHTLPSSFEEFEFNPERQPQLYHFAEAVRDEILNGWGIVLAKGLSQLHLSPGQQQIFYLAFGSALGTPMTQYGLLYPIVDRGMDYTKEAVPVSMTNAETQFHTDSSSVDVNPDILGLLCETSSENGGDSQVVNALHVFEQLKQLDPDLLKLLQKSYIRDIVTPGKEVTADNLLRNCFPIFSSECGMIVFRYMRYWVEKGQARANMSLDQQHLSALDKLDELLTAPENMVSFPMQAGEILWINNKTIAHNRTAYRDTETNIRKLYRMWVTVEN